MADYGFLLKNENGDTLVDSSYRNHALREEVILTPVDTYCYTDHVFLQDIRMNLVTRYLAEPLAHPPIVAVQSYDSYIAFVDMITSGSFITACTLRSSDIAPFHYKMFNPPPLANSEWGIAVYDPQGAKVFDGETKYFRIVDVVQVATPAVPAKTGNMAFTDTTTFNHAYSANPFYVVNSLRGYCYTHINPGLDWWNDYRQNVTLGIKAISSTQASLGWLQNGIVWAGGGPVIERDMYQTVFVVEGD